MVSWHLPVRRYQWRLYQYESQIHQCNHDRVLSWYHFQPWIDSFHWIPTCICLNIKLITRVFVCARTRSEILTVIVISSLDRLSKWILSALTNICSLEVDWSVEEEEFTLRVPMMMVTYLTNRKSNSLTIFCWWERFYYASFMWCRNSLENTKVNHRWVLHNSAIYHDDKLRARISQ